MAKSKATPLSETLLPSAKGDARPAPEPGQVRRLPPQDRVSMSFRITRDAHELLRRLAYETRRSQQDLVDEALEGLAAKHNERTAA
ncbi:MAG: ribbon-helix-helix domain-containing protein [Alphaproteobacteria bacterium]|nr:ribbon-helix-helix domain-containing protein [Alphaproteobacteria bacterium]